MRRAGKIMLYGLAGLLLLPAALVGTLQLPAIQRSLAAHLPGWTGGMVQAEGLEGTLPQHLRLARLRLRDKQGVWLEIDGLALDWRPWAWLHHEVAIDRLAVARLHLLRAPVAQAETPASPEPFHLPDLPRVSVRSLALPDIVLDAAVAGQAQRLALAAQGMAQPDGQHFTLRLDTREGTPMQLRAEGVLAGQILRASLQAQEAPGGLLGRMARIAPEATLRLAAQGQWNGTQPRTPQLNAQLHATEDATPLADLTLTSAPQGGHYHLRAEGSLPGPLRAEAALAALRAENGPDLRLAGEAWQEAQAWHWHLAEGQIGSVALRSDGIWPQEADGAVRMEAVIDAPLAPWSGLAGRDLGGQAHLRITAGGALAALRADTEIALSALAMEGQALPDTKLSATLVREGPRFALSPLQWQLGGVTASGEAAYEEGKWQAQFAVPPVGLAAWRALLPPDALPAAFGGTLGLQAQAEGQGADWRAETQAVLDGLRGLPPVASGVVGAHAALRAKLRQSQGVLHIEQAALTSAGGIAAKAEGTWANGLADLRAEATLADARRLGAGIPGGAPELAGSWKGGPEAGRATWRLHWLPTGLPALDAEGRAEVTPDTLRLEQVSAHFGPAALTAEGMLPRGHSGGKAEATAHLAVPDLAPLGKLIGQPLAGTLRAEAVLQGKAAKASADLAGLHAPGIAARQMQLRAQIADFSTMDGLTAQLQGAALAGANWQLDTLQAEARGEARIKGEAAAPIATRLSMRGTAQDQPLDLTAAGRWRQPKAGQHVVALAALSGHALGEALGLAAPTEASFGPEAMRLSPTRLSWGALHVEAQLTQAKGQVQGGLRLEKVALDRLRNLGALPHGSMEAELALSGAAAAPKAEWRSQLHLSPSDRTQADIALNGAWQGGARATPLTAQLHAATRQTDGPSGALDGQLATEGRLSLQPFALALPPSAPLSGQVQGHLPLALLNPWLRAAGHKLDGTTDIALHLGGTLGAPKPDGHLRLSDAAYDHLPSGLCLRHLQGEIEASAEALRLTALRATDTEQHVLNAQGSLGFGGSKPVDFTLDMPSHHLFCGGLASGNAAGNLAVHGNLAQRLAATGTLTLGPMAVTMPEGDKAGDIPQLTLLESKKAGAKKNAPQEDKPGIVDLNIAVSVPGRLFVRGRGLDAEFGGDLAVRGTADAPDVVGDLSTRRGRFTLLDRQLSLTRAILRFTGPIPPSPQLDILAETNVTDTTLRVTLTGSALAPELKLDSTPALPSDEVLALLLFGRRLENISAFQALQLAQAARQLAGKGGGPGAIDSVRNLLGLDTLSLDQDASGESTVGTGKYLADGVYVGLEQGRRPESRRVRTELEVIPDVNVQTTTTSDGQTGAGVEWKWDY